MDTDKIFEDMMNKLGLQFYCAATGAFGAKFFIVFTLPHFRIERHDDAVIDKNSSNEINIKVEEDK